MLPLRTAVAAALLLAPSLAVAQEWEEAEPEASAPEAGEPAPAPDAAPASEARGSAAGAARADSDGSQQTVVIVNPEPPPPEPPKRRGRTHDGFYFRAASGISVLTTRFDDGLLLHDRISGAGNSFDLLFGGTPTRGFVLGGGLLSNSFNSRDVRTVDVPADRDSGVHAFALGPFVDYFPNAKRGFHFGGMLGLAGLAVVTPGVEEPERATAGGGAVGVWAGYDFWIAREWSLGIMGRYLGVAVENEENRWQAVADSFSLSFTVLYH